MAAARQLSWSNCSELGGAGIKPEQAESRLNNDFTETQFYCACISKCQG